MQSKKILSVTPKFPWPVTGAAESDRVEGIKQLLELGFEVRLIAKITPSKLNQVEPVANELGIKIFPFTYKYLAPSKLDKLKKYFKILFKNPLLLDGAAYEYTDPELVRTYKSIIDQWKPDYVIFDMTYMWPLIKYAKSKGIKVITRSHNYEPEHFIQEKGKSLLNITMYWAKLITEYKTTKNSDLVLAITPADKAKYKKIGVQNVKVLPLRGLPRFLKMDKEISQDFPLQVFFPGGTYNVEHNRKGLEFIIKEIAPQVHRKMPGKFVFNFLGSKFPEELKKYLDDNTKYLGFVENFEATMKDMDIALVPSLSGGGMQQKIFEALTRGMPTVTSDRGLAGYDFRDKEHLLTADTAQDFINALEELLDSSLRQRLSANAIKLSQKLFSRDKIDAIVRDNIAKL